MSETALGLRSPPYRFAWSFLWLAIVCAVALVAGFYEGIHRMVDTWLSTEEYSHGTIIPLIAAFLIWQRKNELQRLQFSGHWAGVLIVFASVLLNLLGQLATVFALQQYSLVLALCGLTVAMGGWRLLLALWAPLLILMFMIPLPNFVLNGLSLQLQLYSSQLGVWFIRLFGVSVFLEGNVIDLGTYQLQVAEACSGLRYLFPLMTLGFIVAYFFKVALWKRALLFFSTIPLTLVMNSLRIGIIGVLVDRWGVSMAEGFLHQFEGWVVFMASAAILMLEMVVLARIGADGRPWREVFGLEMPATLPGRGAQLRPIPATFIVATVVLGVYALAGAVVPQRTEVIPKRETFAEFPQQVGAWNGRRDTLEAVYVDALKFDDYILADYTRSSQPPVNFYVAWYDSQTSGQSTHSPRSCMPGGGWKITDFRQAEVPAMQLAGQPLRVNRVLIESGRNRQLVYYWFQQRGRIVTNEYAVKWYLFVDSLFHHRSDGALIRLVVPIGTSGGIEAADKALQDFATTVAPQLSRYIPT